MPAFERRRALALAIALAGIYACVGLLVIDGDALFSIDAAIKLLQAEALTDSGFASVALTYPAADLDPERRFLPFGQPFVFRHDGAIQGVYPIAVAMLNALALSLGAGGLVLLSVASALVALLCAGRLDDSGNGTWVTFVLGACTPFWAYAVLPWEHLPAVACGTMSWLLLEHGSTRRSLVAGVLLGVAITLRHEFALLLPGVVVLFLRDARWRRWLAVGAGVTIPLVAVAVMDLWVYDRPPYSHLSHAVSWVWSLAGSGSAVQRPETLPLSEQIEIVVGYWLFGLPVGVSGVAVLIAGLAATWLVPGAKRQFAVLGVLVAAAALVTRDLIAFVPRPDLVAGLLRVSPVLVFAFLPVRSPAGASRQRLLELGVVVFFICGLLTSGRHAGAQIGPRFLLAALPLVVALAWQGFDSYRKGPDPADRLIAGLGVMLTAGSFAMQALVNLPTLVRVNMEERPIAEALRAAPAPAIVIDDIYLIKSVAFQYSTTDVLLASTQEHMTDLSRRLLDGGVTRVALLRDRSRPLTLPDYGACTAVETPRTVLAFCERPAATVLLLPERDSPATPLVAAAGH